MYFMQLDNGTIIEVSQEDLEEVVYAIKGAEETSRYDLPRPP
jgi:hypothetical protein